MHLTEKFAKPVTGTAYADLPQAGVDKAKDCILDCIGIAIAGKFAKIIKSVNIELDSY